MPRGSAFDYMYFLRVPPPFCCFDSAFPFESQTRSWTFSSHYRCHLLCPSFLIFFQSHLWNRCGFKKENPNARFAIGLLYHSAVARKWVSASEWTQTGSLALKCFCRMINFKQGELKCKGNASEKRRLASGRIGVLLELSSRQFYENQIRTSNAAVPSY